ncbi:Ubiquinol-cytochrome C chaperone [invertebrate metagenome]|uniref:Ubiquinol-cytochrome C chaperone n=1 Tax=invertebrate metagenome TaxID=1711999 RepID=A0A484HAV5_9ZZZZ
MKKGLKTGIIFEANMVGTLFHPASQAARVLYGLVVSRARHSIFYTRFGVADTVDGRFDMIVLHAFLLLRRLGQEGAGLAQALFDEMFSDMDSNLREMGVSDLRVGSQVNDMVKAFYGRVSVYDTALASPDNQLLAAALWRNVYRGAASQREQVHELVIYVREVAARLATLSIDNLSFGALPE